MERGKICNHKRQEEWIRAEIGEVDGCSLSRYSGEECRESLGKRGDKEHWLHLHIWSVSHQI